MALVHLLLIWNRKKWTLLAIFHIQMELAFTRTTSCNVKQVPVHYTYIAHPCSAIFYIIQMVLRLTGVHYILDPNGHSVRFKIF